jgi:Lon protease-like protein
MGIWSGHKAIYGTDQHNEMLELPAAVESSGNDTEAGPMDGFVAPQNQESNRLVVIPAQSRSTFTSEYAISKYALKSVSMSDESGLLRPDVTLSKALELLMQYALIPSDSSGSVLMKKQSARISPRAETTVRHRRSRRSRVLRRDNSDVSSSSYTALHHPAGSRTEINPHFLTALGVSEKGLDTGAIGGIRATLDSDTEEDEVPAVESRTVRGWDAEDDEDANDWTNSEDDHDEEIGGAFARHYGSPTPTPGEKDSPTAKTITIPPSKSTAPAILTPETLHCALLDVLECQLCYMLLYQPLTTPCGHTFCRQCFARSLDHSSSCPLCRADMPSFSFFQSHPSNEIILKLLTATWEESGETEDISMSPSPSKPSAEQQQQHLGLKLLYQERQISVDKEARESLLSTPLFVCTLAFPHMPTILHIFEPRYRLMIRRCLESGFARFGMVLHSTDTTGPVPGMSRYGTMLEIKTVQMLPDGRSMIETVGSHRFRVLERGSLDGYTVGQIERIDDVLPEQEDQAERAALGMVDPNSPPSILAEAREAQAAFQAAIGVDFSRGEEQRQEQAVNILDNFAQRNTDQLVAVCTDFIETLQSGSAPWLMTRLNNTYGPMPEATNVAAFGYWMALVMPIDEHEKAKLLPIRSPRLRLRIVVHWIEQLRQTWWFNNGCSVQ